MFAHHELKRMLLIQCVAKKGETIATAESADQQRVSDETQRSTPHSTVKKAVKRVIPKTHDGFSQQDTYVEGF